MFISFDGYDLLKMIAERTLRSSVSKCQLLAKTTKKTLLNKSCGSLLSQAQYVFIPLGFCFVFCFLSGLCCLHLEGCAVAAWHTQPCHFTSRSLKRAEPGHRINDHLGNDRFLR